MAAEHAFRYCYENAEGRFLLNNLWHSANLRDGCLSRALAIGWRKNEAELKARVYEKPGPHQRLDSTTILDQLTATALDADAEPLNPAEITRRVNRIKHQLVAPANSCTQAGHIAGYCDPTKPTMVTCCRQMHMRLG